MKGQLNKHNHRLVMRGSASRRLATTTVCCAMVVVMSTVASQVAASSEFQPYQNNGGLVSAVAGQNFVILASDSRMVGPGGYDILERHHLSSRIWSATDAAVAEEEKPGRAIELDSGKNNIPTFVPDGSLSSALAFPDEDLLPQPEALSLRKRIALTSHSGCPVTPVLVGSAGCNTDCEMLKRLVRSDLRAAHYFAENQLQPSQVATLLSQILYSRRSFPFYSFCVVAGLEQDGVGHVYVYDAIGSYEQVGVATCGTGRELLQPILDRKFRAAQTTVEVAGNNSPGLPQVEEDDRRMQLFGRIPLTQVDCSPEEAISILLEGYRAVSEREIGVGDRVVICALEQKGDDVCECQVWTAPLKKH